MVWRGDAGLDPSQRGLKVLGAPIGCDEFVRTQLQATATEQASLLQKIPAVRDLQSAWLLLLCCAVPRENFYLRMVRPRLSEEFVEVHDGAVWQCFCQLVGIAGISEEARRAAEVPMILGILGLCLVAGEREAETPGRVRSGGELPHPPRSTKFRSCTGMCEHVARGTVLKCQRGRQWSQACAWGRTMTTTTQLSPTLAMSTSGKNRLAQLDESRTGVVEITAGASCQQCLDGIPTSRSTRIDPQPFRVLLCRRHLPIPFSSCTMVRNLDIEGENPIDARRLGIVVDGLTIFDSAQLAVDRGRRAARPRTTMAQLWRMLGGVRREHTRVVV